MGIKGLLRFMKPFIEPVHIKKYAGKRVGIDAYSWLHKGAYSCSTEICLDSNSEKKFRYIAYFMHRVNLLRYHKITPVVVFDGASIPSKAATENERNRRREENRELAIAKLKKGDVKAATELFQKAVRITPAMAHQLIQILKSEKVEFVVAPYEADAQLAYLATLEVEKGGVAAVITEDSDLIAYGCPAITFKMDHYGNGEELVLPKVFDSLTSKPSFRNFDKELFTGMCVLAGCDFLPSVPGIGIVKAHSFATKYRNLDRVLSVLKIEKGSQMPEDYPKSFKEAVAVFQHARIYDAEIKELKHLKSLTEQLLQHLDEGLDFLGPEIPPLVAAAIAEGKLDPTTMEAFHCNQPEPDNVQTSVETANNSRQASCFTVVSSHKTREKKKIGTMSMKQVAVSAESKYFQDAGLEKLAFPVRTHTKKENAVLKETPLNVPNNNPFKKRKLEDVTKLVSSEGKDEKLEISCVFPDNSQLTFSENDCLSDRKLQISNQIESIAEQISMVTEVELADTLCINMGSQESVSSDSRPKRVFSGRRVQNDKLKRSNHNSSEAKNSILNFFARV
ncbi:exonuclease 1-like [Hibiscus syriacus]|uniref:exonuclease 1-like n=1 Tax=Hibiscus syriacus TaxID=106335 RepID=UPI0019236CD8|nr:exonuclease 1-like [Hibiscus syriacus]